MKRFLQLSILAHFLFIIPHITLAQKNTGQGSICGETKMRQFLLEENEDAKELIKTQKQKLEIHTKNYIKNKRLTSKNGRVKEQQEIIIPVVFHVFDNGTDGVALSDEDIKEGIKNLNKDFAGENDEFSQIPDFFKARAAKTKIKFKLAKLDPEGRPTNGINRYAHEEFANDADANGIKDISQWPPERYLNVWTALKFKRLLGAIGFAYTPEGIHEGNKGLDGIVILKNFIKRGHTFAHEVGHYLNLAHTWGTGQVGASENCNKDDGVSDTPNTIGNRGTRCGEVVSNCGSRDNIENHMDYTGCSLMFTKGQEDRMVALLNSSIANRNQLHTEQNLINAGVKDNISLNPGIFTQTKIITESFENKGNIDQKIVIQAKNGALFTKLGDLNQNSDFTIENLPLGLTAKINVKSTTNATLTLEGAANLHEKKESVNNILVRFKDNTIKGITNPEFKNLPELGIVFNNITTEYCNLRFDFYGLWPSINRVKFKEIDRISTPETRIKGDFEETHVGTAKQGETFQLTLEGDTYIGKENKIRVWVDWNGNKIYENNERIDHTITINEGFIGKFNIPIEINVPSNAKIGKTQIQILSHSFDTSNPTLGENPCDNLHSGDAETYGLIIYPSGKSLMSNFSASTVHPRTNDSITFKNLSLIENGNQISSQEWTFENGTPSLFSGTTPPKVIFKTTGKHTVSLKITDNRGNIDTKSEDIFSRIEYCTPSGILPYTESSISNVKFNTINNSSTESTYSDYTNAHKTEVKKGMTYPLEITISGIYSGKPQEMVAWIDWNGNSEWDDTEQVATKLYGSFNTGGDSELVITENLTIPEDAVTAEVNLRVLISPYGHPKYYGCPGFYTGEVEDYRIIIKDQNDISSPISIIENASDKIIDTGESLQFNSISTGQVDNQLWELFNDNAPSTILFSGTNTSFNHTFLNAGSYTLKLTTSNTAGSNSSEIKITVNERVVIPEIPVAIIENASDKIFEPNELKTFTSSSTGKINSLNWRLYSNEQSEVAIHFSNEKTLSYTFKNEGKYTLKLKVKNEAGENETEIKITVKNKEHLPQAPTAKVEGKSNYEIEKTTSLSFNSASLGIIDTYYWKLYNNDTPANIIKESNERNISFTFENAGEFTLELSVENQGGNDTHKVSILVKEKAVIKPIAIIDGGKKLELEQDEIKTFTHNSAGIIKAFSWSIYKNSLSQDNKIETSTKNNFQYQFTEDGNFIVELKVENTAGNDVATVEVKVNKRPIEEKLPIVKILGYEILKFTKNTTLNLSNSTDENIEKYHWTLIRKQEGLPDQTISSSTEKTFKPELNENGDYTIHLSVSNTKGTSSDAINLTLEKDEQTDNVLSKDPENQSNISIYPNPNHGIFTIEIKDNQNLKVELITTGGHLLGNYLIKKKVSKIDISNFKSGIYLLRIKSEKNLYIKKIIKK